METINEVKVPKIYNIVIFNSDELEEDKIKKVFGDTFGYDFIYATQKLLEIKNAGKTEIGVYSKDIGLTLIEEIKEVAENINVELCEVVGR